MSTNAFTPQTDRHGNTLAETLAACDIDPARVDYATIDQNPHSEFYGEWSFTLLPQNDDAFQYPWD